jgi:hypothetical protein
MEEMHYKILYPSIITDGNNTVLIYIIINALYF